MTSAATRSFLFNHGKITEEENLMSERNQHLMNENIMKQMTQRKTYSINPYFVMLEEEEQKQKELTKIKK